MRSSHRGHLFLPRTSAPLVDRLTVTRRAATRTAKQTCFTRQALDVRDEVLADATADIEADEAIAFPAPSHVDTGQPDSVFVAASEDIVGDVDMLDMIDLDPACRQAVRDEIDDVIAREAPISAVRLARVVGRRFTLQRVAAKRAASIIDVVPAAQLEETPFGTFVWPPGQSREDYDDFRGAGEDGIRGLDEIAPHEILNAMRYLARTGAGISRDELVKETAALFGYSRIAAKARSHFEAVVNYGVQRGQLCDDGSAIVVES